jgi:serine protease Do
MGLDGTMSDYCDVFRTSGEDQPMAVEVLRYSTGEVLRGELNSDTPIEVVFSPAAEVEDEVDVDTGGTTYTEYVSIYDDTDTIIVDVPVEWNDIETAPIEVDGQTVPYVGASTDLDGFINGFDTPGMQFVLFGPTNPEDMLARWEQSGGCVDGGIYEYSDPVFTGLYQIWEDCGDNGTITVVLAAVPDDGAYTALMIVGIVTDADFDALDTLFATFNVLE